MKKYVVFLLLAILCTSSFCEQYAGLKSRLAAKYEGSSPALWGEDVPGVLKRLDTRDRAIALTFDACGSQGDGFDSSLFYYLVKNHINATFFISGRWIDRHPAEFKKIYSDSLFEIENHGLNHKPASVNGRSVYGLKGTETPAELVEEVELNAEKIEQLTGAKPRFYRSGTAYYDEYAVKLVHDLGYQIAGFSVLGDMGATYKKAQVEKALLGARSGSIVIFHINHPEKETGAGVMAALEKMRNKHIKFVKLKDYSLR